MDNFSRIAYFQEEIYPRWKRGPKELIMKVIWKLAGIVGLAGFLLGEGVLAGRTSEQDAFFVPDKPENLGLSSQALQKLNEEMNRIVQEKRLVGAELVVLKNRRIALHETSGWKDRESRTRLGKNTIFSLRSMAKPLIGLAAQILIDEGRLSPQDKVSRFLPAFGRGPASAISVEHLLTQRSGLPKGSFEDLAKAANLQDLSQEYVLAKLAFDPGSDFLASDAGSDVLGAVIEKASGLDLNEFIRRRLLEPLGMKDTFVFTDSRDPRADRICSAYTGSPGNWNRSWSLHQGPIYRFALGSQSFYSTPLDYARLLSLLLDQGRHNNQRLLSVEAITRILTPVSNVPLDTGFSGVKLRYGQMVQLFMPVNAVNGEPVAFGHRSTDNTFAWAWPGIDLMILFFTQTRGAGVESSLESLVDQTVLHPGKKSGVPEAFGPLLGKYLDVYGPSGLEEISIVFLNGRLAIDIPSQAVFLLDPPDARGYSTIARLPKISIAFEKNDRGEVTGLKWIEGGQGLELPRVGTPAASVLLDRTLKMRAGWKKYVGVYETEQPGQTVEVVLRGGGLGILRKGQTAPLLLRQPDAEGCWRLRVNPKAYVTFQENEKGQVVSFTIQMSEGKPLVRKRIDISEKTEPPGQ